MARLGGKTGKAELTAVAPRWRLMYDSSRTILMNRSLRFGLGILALSTFSGCAVRNARLPATRGTTDQLASVSLGGADRAESRPQSIAESPAALATPAFTVTNAADFYREAMALYDALPSDEKNTLMLWQEEMDEQEAKALCEKATPILDLMRKAAALPNCDWGIANVPQGATYAFGPYLQKCRDLGRVTIWSAANCHPDNATETADELVLGLQFITHRVRQDFLMCFLVTASVHNMASIYIAENAWRFSDTEKAHLVQALNDPQFEENLYLAIEGGADRLIEQAAIDESNMTAEARQPYSETAPYLARTRQLGELEKKLVDALSKSETEYESRLDETRTAEASTPYVKKEWEKIEMAVNLGRATLVRHTMVAAGMAVLESGPSALSNYPDPATGKPFEYQEDADEFQLKSGFQFRGNPITMVFRRRNAAEVDLP